MAVASGQSGTGFAGESGIPGTPRLRLPLGWESLPGVSSRMRPVWRSSRATLAITGRSAQSNPLSLPFCVLYVYASQNRGVHEGRE